MAAAEPPPAQLAQALVDFSVHGSFPEDSVSKLPLDAASLPVAIKALADAKAKLQAEIHAINEETADGVRTWQANAQSIQDDILRSKALAAAIVKASEAPTVPGHTVDEIEAKADFLIRELNYNSQVKEALRGIRTVNRTLDEVEQARDERRILDALHLLEKSWTELDKISVSRSCRAIRLLDIRAFELKSDVHQVFDHVWNALINVDIKNQRVSISSTREDETMSLEDAVIGLKAYKEVDQRTSRLWQDINQAVLLPRLDLAADTVPGIHTEDGALEIRGSTDKSIPSLFADLERVFSFLVQRLPPDLVETISSTLLPETMDKITSVWLDSVVPSSLQDMNHFQDVIAATKDFAARLAAMGFSNLGALQEWTENAPRVWLSKCREAALDSVRVKLSGGLGAPTRVEKVEKQMVSQSEGKQLVASGATASADDHGWGAWDDGDQAVPEETNGGADEPPEGDDDGTDAWGWGEEGGQEEVAPEESKEEPKEEPKEVPKEEPNESKPDDDEEDPSEAWGWGDEAADEVPEVPEPPKTSQPEPQTRELVLKETYSISSLPQPVLDLIFAIMEDGATLTQDTYAGSPVAAQVAGLFSLPTLALAVFRAVSPYYYGPEIGGNMYLYNDSVYLAERLADFASAWKQRAGISPRAQAMLRLDNDIKALHAFANRTYTNELTIQKTILRDLLGGSQNLIHTDDTSASLSSAISRVHSLATAWEDVLARSVWQQAVGALADAVAGKVVSDVMELPSIGQDEAYEIAALIAKVEELDELFLPSRFGVGEGKGKEEEVPMTAQFAGGWLRMKYLSEVLQSNLAEVRFLWAEGELSLYFTPEEVVDLVLVSFEDNPRTKEAIREIRGNVRPLGEGR
ncbi:Centromere/kinetochore protein zw10 [Staphylotrichum tortipilum]|uniref:Centromere/kinetochore protein zw10 n=1 Tax=Staphylotrichum tortipilum TaxID=2831512 RepID=A0AAN6MIZ0_9PEZI|nr:Centromere/kinetochore protein zw10 [Staphylotrichum longicolle]